MDGFSLLFRVPVIQPVVSRHGGDEMTVPWEGLPLPRFVRRDAQATADVEETVRRINTNPSRILLR